MIKKAGGMMAKVKMLVGFNSSVTAQEMKSLHTTAGTTVIKAFKEINVHLVMLEKDILSKAVSVYRGSGIVDFIEADAKIRLELPPVNVSVVPNDPGLQQQWGLQAIRAEEAWSISPQDSLSTRIAILDTGIDTAHPDLAEKIIISRNFTNSPTVEDQFGHGTHVAGIAAAITNNNIGVAGVSFNNAYIMNIKVLGDSGSGDWSWLADGILFAVNNNANVINMSLGGTSQSDTVRRAIDYAVSNGVAVAAAAGNDSSNTPQYPAAYSGVISVAATNQSDQLAEFSNYGAAWVDVAAPGVEILSTTPGNSYGFLSGTSMATPFVSGLAALILTTYPDLSGTEAANVIRQSCDPISGTGELFLNGRINAEAALMLPRSLLTNVEPEQIQESSSSSSIAPKIKSVKKPVQNNPNMLRPVKNTASSLLINLDESSSILINESKLKKYEDARVNSSSSSSLKPLRVEKSSRTGSQGPVYKPINPWKIY
ncbi:S8 family serine peptidase [Fictibacillus aquaticus]|uniref:Uncharacterized protein n=1 Tax=Fictibacillus aquaticus TaxID=2021314 RepID=A0A235FDM5_9BACL|nr:S8 family serine peptidase [Fictibacillus aquaticus]OYD59024.1 hypothetical protein CGZ90_03735 [Fictibacillus aquaticus]